MKLEECRRTDCRYRAAESVHSCNYAEITGRTQLGQIYRAHGFTVFTKEAAYYADPSRCPFYKSDRRSDKWEARDEQFQALYNEGLKDQEIAAATGYSNYCVLKWRQRKGLPPSGSGRRSPKVDRKILNELYRKGLSDACIAEQVGCSANLVYKWRHERGFPSNFKVNRKKEYTDG